LRKELQPDVQVIVIEPGEVATELSDHMYEQLAITAQDIAEIIAFAVTRPRRLTLNEILVRPSAQHST
jgi:NADP-dependent 3-hydroxy acid dehydrogenase YdfG